jgi:hypothetical protein
VPPARCDGAEAIDKAFWLRLAEDWLKLARGQAEQAAIDGLAVGRSRGKAMANEGLINLLGWSRRERERLQMQREMLQSGKFKLLKDEGSGPIDVSSQNIVQITANIAELDLILADYDVSPCLTNSRPTN